MKTIKNGICAVNGFKALGKHIGIKKGSKDFAVIYSESSCSAAGVFTQNSVKGAPVYISIEHLKDGKAQAVVINSGISNVSTGKKGLSDAADMAKLTADELGVSENDVLVASTGLIGAYLPMEKIVDGIKGVKSELGDNGSDAAEAILTTDKVKKEIAVTDDGFTIGAIAKGSGMIYPNMATMLGFIATDAKIGSKKLKDMLKKAVDKSFNMVSVDMQTSTSDMVLLLANGKVEVDEKKFQDALDFVCVSLAKMIAKDGEGASKLIEVNVQNAFSDSDAKKAAKAVVCSDLFKCAVYGNDPNWGRIMCSIGNSKAKFDEGGVDIYFGSEKIVKNGAGIDFNKKKVLNIMKGKELKVVIDFNSGDKSATAYGCDLTEEYVKINAHYHT
jgi:glutamate N-acetyltransferase/amino-acid N-acetyltransferase